jgi:hypothetical protein
MGREFVDPLRQGSDVTHIGSLDMLFLTWIITEELKYGALVSGFETIK